VPARGYKNVDVRLVIDPDKLPSWTLNGGSQGGNGDGLNGPEYDGYITITADAEKLSVPWHVLPRRAAYNESQWINKRGANLALWLNNTGHELGQYELFSLMATSPKVPKANQAQPGDNFATVDLRAVGARYLAPEVCGVGGGCLEFAINMHDRHAHPAYPAGVEVDIDTNGDGVVDYYVYTGENGGFNVTGQTLIYVQKVGAASGSAYFYADADLNSGNMIMTLPLGALGVAAGTTLNFSVLAYDNYFSGLVTDEITGMRFTPGAARFNAEGYPFGDVPSKTGGRINVSRSNVPAASSTESGLLMMHRRNARQEADILNVN
jgi:minor extracellular serine protease Vpr